MVPCFSDTPPFCSSSVRSYLWRWYFLLLVIMLDRILQVIGKQVIGRQLDDTSVWSFFVIRFVWQVTNQSGHISGSPTMFLYMAKSLAQIFSNLLHHKFWMLSTLALFHFQNFLVASVISSSVMGSNSTVEQLTSYSSIHFAFLL